MRRLYRCRWDKKIGGVCGGLGQYFRIDPTLIRLAMVFMCIVTGVAPTLLIYVLAWMLMPLGPPAYIQLDCKKLYRSRSNRKIAGICGGIAEFINTDPILIRIVALALLFLTGIAPLLITYLIGCVIIPEHPLSNYRHFEH